MLSALPDYSFSYLYLRTGICVCFIGIYVCSISRNILITLSWPPSWILVDVNDISQIVPMCLNLNFLNEKN